MTIGTNCSHCYHWKGRVYLGLLPILFINTIINKYLQSRRETKWPKRLGSHFVYCTNRGLVFLERL